MEQSGRLHAFDNLRAIMMWLGVVLHVAVNHLTGPSPLPWRDSQTSPIADLILVFIHAFRMPVFFILSGYFVALLVAHRGNQGMLTNRLRRLALPFAIFWPVLIVCTTLLVLVYLHVMAYGTAGIDLSLLTRNSKTASPFVTMHMWFIYYLIWFCVFTALLAPFMGRVPAKLRDAIDTGFRVLAAHWWGPLVLAIPLAIIGSSYRAGVLAPSGSATSAARTTSSGAPPGLNNGFSGSISAPSCCALTQSSPSPRVKANSCVASNSKPLMSRRLA